jgi:hypothetical protein
VTTWVTAIVGAALIGVAVFRLDERSCSMPEDADGLNRAQRQRQAALIAAREVVSGLWAPDALAAGDLILFAEYIRTGTIPPEES